MLLSITGWCSVFFAVVMSGIYLANEKGSLFDPIPVSWGGFLLFFGLSMISLADMEPMVDENIRTMACSLVLIGILFYSLGLYAGKGKTVVAMMPLTSPNLKKLNIWMLWVCSFTGFMLLSFSLRFMPSAIYKIMGGITVGFLGATALTSIYAVLSLKRSMFTSLIMLVSAAVAIAIFLNVFFSKRPLIGILIATMGYIYTFKVSKYSAKIKGIFILVIVALSVLLTLYLATSRMQRRYADAAGEAPPLLSQQALVGLLGGVNVNFLAFELAMEKIPDEVDYLYGSGMVPLFLFFIPRSVWPNKPVSSGYFISQLWFGRDDPPWNISPLPIGELYMNFGVLGIVIGFFIIGRIVRILNTYLSANRGNSIIWISWLMIIPDFAGEWRGDFTSMTIQAMMRVSVFVVLVWMIQKLFRVNRSGQPMSRLSMMANGANARQRPRNY